MCQWNFLQAFTDLISLNTQVIGIIDYRHPDLGNIHKIKNLAFISKALSSSSELIGFDSFILLNVSLSCLPHPLTSTLV